MGLSEQQEHDLRVAYARKVAERRALLAPQMEHAERLGRAHDLDGVPAAYLDERSDPVGDWLGAAGLLQGLAAFGATASVLGTARDSGSVPWPGVTVTVVLLAGAAVCIVRWWRTAPRRSWVYVFPDGLVTQDHRGTVRATRWTEVLGAEYVLDPESEFATVTAYRLRAAAGDVLLPVSLLNAHDPYDAASGIVRSVLPGPVAATMPGFPTLHAVLTSAGVLAPHVPGTNG